MSLLLLAHLTAYCNSNKAGGGANDGTAGDSSSGNAGSNSSNGSSNSSNGSVVIAGTVPTIGGCAVFSADNPWNTRIDDTAKFPVHPLSATYAKNMAQGAKVHPDWGNWSTDHYGIPWQVVPASQASVKMIFTASSDESDPGPYPFPANALVEGGANSGGDMHVLVLQSGSCTLFETWDSSYANASWSAGSGAKWSLNSDTLRADGWTSADAAGLPILPGLVKLSEVNGGAINHAIRFTMAATQQGYIHPATHAAGSANAALPPMGLRLRLKASFDISKFTGPALVVATALKQYGIILADNGSNWYITGDSDDGWTTLMDGLVQQLGRIVGSDFEAVNTGAISTSGL